MFCGLVDRKQAMLDYINIDLKKPKILHFSKRVSPWFLVEKLEILSFFLFQQNRPKESVF